MKSYNDILLEAISKLTKPEDEEIDEALDFSNRGPRPIASPVRNKEKVFISPMMKGQVISKRPTDAWAGNRAAGLGETYSDALKESINNILRKLVMR